MPVDAQLSRPASFTEEEIQIKPSTELIPDEYERACNGNISVHIFYANTDANQNNCRTFIETMESLGFKIDANEDLYDIQRINYLEAMERIRNRSQGSDGLILVYTGFYKTENNLLFYHGTEEKQVSAKDIWTRFTSKNCPWLQNKPKLFLFQATKYGITEQMDGERRLSRKFTYESTYGVPAEADILIVYNKTDGIAGGGDPQAFLSQVCNNIRLYGKSEDVSSLITCTECTFHATRPVLISTLTRKFFFTISQFRGHHLYINEKQDEVVKTIQELHDTLKTKSVREEKRTEGDRDKEKKSRFSFNFGKKREDKHKHQEITEDIDGHVVVTPENNGNNHSQTHISSLKHHTTEKKNIDHHGTISDTTKISAHMISHLQEHQETLTDHKHSITTNTNNSTSHNIHQHHGAQSTASSTKITTTTTLTSSSRKASTSSLGSKSGGRNPSGSDSESARGSLRGKKADQEKKNPIPWRW